MFHPDLLHHSPQCMLRITQEQVKYHTIHLMIPPGFGRPPSMPFAMHGNIPIQQSDNVTNIAQNNYAPQPPMQSMQPLPHLQPLQPPQLPHPQLTHKVTRFSPCS